MAGRKQQTKAVVAEEEASFKLLDEWLRIENEHTDPGFVIPGRGQVVAWCERHPLTVLFAAGVAIWLPLLSVITAG